MHPVGGAVKSRPDRDRGAVLPLVLVLIVVAGFVVIPLMGYAMAVLRSNTIVSERTKATEAAKGGVRMVLADPRNVFLECDGGGDLTPADPVLNGISVSVTCTEIEEIGPLNALGFEVPIAAVANQLGATVPVEFSGDRAESASVPPYPVDPPSDPACTSFRPEAWWCGQASPTAIDGTIWMPDLPQLPSTVRTATPFDMPSGFGGCRVYFPGRYTDALDLAGEIYFASGVYYFEQPITIADGADVVVGYGLDELSNPDCSDDIQVAANVVGDPGTFDINGGGATWVFGADARLIIDDTAATSNIRLRFNQRYADADRGGRISLMTVNGDDDAAADDHEVTDVNHVPESLVLNGAARTPLAGSGYAPSSSALTDKARLPGRISNSQRADTVQRAGVAPDRGGVLVTWDELAGQDAGGARLGVQSEDGSWAEQPYIVEIREGTPGAWLSGWSTVCTADELVVTPKPDPADGNEVSCLIDGLTVGSDYRVRAQGVNEVGPSGLRRSVDFNIDAASPIVAVPDEPANVLVAPGAADDSAVVTWDVPDNGGAPITAYTVVATRVFLEPQPDLDPIAPTASLDVVAGSTATVEVPAYDPNGDPLTVVVDDSALQAIGANATVVPGALEIAVDATAVVAPVPLPVDVDYTVEDADGSLVAGTIEVGVLATQPPNRPPVAGPMVLTPDVGVPITVQVPAHDPDGDPLTLVVDDSALDAAWTITPGPSPLDVTILTSASDGTYSIPYTVTDPSGTVASNVIDVTVARGHETVATCDVSPGTLLPVRNACEFTGLGDLVPGDATSGNIGYRFDVIATNAIGQSEAGQNAEPYPLAFDGGGTSLEPQTRLVEPWVPEAIIEIVGDNAAIDLDISIAGYVATPMGRIHVDNPDGDSVRIAGGVLSGTFDVDDARLVTGAAGSVPVGFINDIVLQRKVSVRSTAENITATAVVQVNEDGAGYAINAWIVQ